MPLFYFDSYENGVLTPDDVGLELSDIEAARLEAAKSLDDLSADAQHIDRHELAVVVSNHAREPLLMAILVFDVVDLASAAQAISRSSE
ncbi:DUF6894 family protein [Pseudaminobacter sp. NGMCC 1.201702]|uniref:DUF6894 family protein n=1 Tax=Pseudaminobacter sp. NGMCC 1.201702 TaxID=3391825 RepID=UPI0039F12D01